FEEDLVDIEIVNTIPFSFEVVDIKTDFNLNEKKRTNEGLVFTWKKDQIKSGKKISVEYILRKRIERSIVLRKQNKVSVITSYYSVTQDMQAQVNFVNTSGSVFREILIEDVIPPELVVNNAETTQTNNIKPVTIPTSDSTLYRWIFSSFLPGDNFSVEYDFREKPLTRYYIDEIECGTAVIKLEKISQPVIDSAQCEYLWYYSITNLGNEDFSLTDRIPSDFNLTLVDPLYLRPSIIKEKTQQLLLWKLNKSEKSSSFIVRITGKESFTPLAPSIKFSQGKDIQLIERSSKSEKKLVDIRRLKEMQKETI
ncbi:MAG: hypothetical protein ACXACR_14230, partial [Candidatus Hodarchaeales archaeon]